MRQFTHAGTRFVLGRGEFGYGIWQIGREFGDPVMGFPATEEGWASAYREFQRFEPGGQPLAPQARPSLPAPRYPGVPAYPAAPPPPAPSNGAATAGGTLGIVGAVLSLIPFLGIVIGLVMGTLAIVFSGVGISRAGPPGRGKGLAVTGLVLGILTVIFKLIPGVDVL